MSTQLTDAELARLEELAMGAVADGATESRRYCIFRATPALVAELRRLRGELEQVKHGMEAAYMSGRADGREAIR